MTPAGRQHRIRRVASHLCTADAARRVAAFWALGVGPAVLIAYLIGHPPT